MLIAGGWGYNSIIATKPELEEKIGTELTPAGPSGKGTAFAGGSHLVQFTESEQPGAGRRVRRLHARARPAEQVHERDRLPARARPTASRPRATSRTRSASRSPSSCCGTRRCTRRRRKWGGLEGANIFDGEIQKVMKGEETAQEAVAEARDEDGRGVRRVSSCARQPSSGARERAPRPPAMVIARRAVNRLTLPVLLLLPALIIIAGWSAIRSSARSTCRSRTPASAS